MLVNLTDVFTNEGQVQELDVVYEADVITNRFGTFAIKEKSPAALRISNIGQSRALVEGNVKLTVVFPCDRCLEDVEHVFDISFSYEVASPDDTGASETDDGDSVQEFMEGYCLDADRLVSNEILLNWPMKILCRADCKGICKVCGRNLNKGACGCEDFVPDPRMAAIKDIFEAARSDD